MSASFLQPSSNAARPPLQQPTGRKTKSSDERWPDDRVELLTKLWQHGLSARQIATELGDGFTRNAILGRVHRMGLERRAVNGTPVQGAARAAPAPRQPRPAKAAPAPKVAADPAAQKQAQIRAKLAAEVVAAPKVGPSDVLPESRMKPLWELKNRRECRWPIGDPRDPDFAYCAADCGEATYCAPHRKLAYQPRVERQRNPSPYRAPIAPQYQGWGG